MTSTRVASEGKTFRISFHIDARAIFQRGFFRPKESWYDAAGQPFNPGNYYNVGGNSKFYGAVLTRYRREEQGDDGSSFNSLLDCFALLAMTAK